MGRENKTETFPPPDGTCFCLSAHDIEKISESKVISHTIVMGRIGVDCVNMDSFSLAVERCRECSYLLKGKGENRILVLNLANPVNPGGGVRRGAKAQEEDLCRRSSLLLVS